MSWIPLDWFWTSPPTFDFIVHQRFFCFYFTWQYCIPAEQNRALCALTPLSYKKKTHTHLTKITAWFGCCWKTQHNTNHNICSMWFIVTWRITVPTWASALRRRFSEGSYVIICLTLWQWYKWGHAEDPCYHSSAYSWPHIFYPFISPSSWSCHSRYTLRYKIIISHFTYFTMLEVSTNPGGKIGDKAVKAES